MHVEAADVRAVEVRMKFLTIMIVVLFSVSKCPLNLNERCECNYSN